ncbi:MAG: phytanoyl-CoA dioxygenase family protein [Rhodospirillales bacterium]|nr:phytanoyl-CoA dioxygenase family protein [Rhodospirillales bacterium]
MIPTFKSSCSSKDLLAAIQDKGGAIVEGLAPVNLMDEIATDLDPYFDGTPLGEGYFVGTRTKRMGALFVKAPAAQELVMNPLVLDVAQAVLGPNCSRFQLNLTEAIQIWPGEPEQILHRDDELFPFAHTEIECMINAIWAYSDFTEINGATRIVPGSHKEELDRDPPEDRICQAVMPRGSVLLYLGSAVHSGGANKSDQPRTALTMSYNLGYLRQAENQYLAVPPEVAKTLPKDLQELIGYSIHAPRLGWLECQDPGDLLNSDTTLGRGAKDFLPQEIENQLAERHAVLVQNYSDVSGRP